MQPKKTARADLNRYSFLFFNIGLITSLSLVIVAFTYKVPVDVAKSDLTSAQAYHEEILEVPSTEQLPPPPQIRQPEIVEVPNTTKIENEIMVNMDSEVTDAVEAVAPAMNIEEEEEDYSTVFTVVEESASPVGGISAFNEFISRNIIYPKQARKLGIEGRVYMEFVVERDGSITNIKTLKGIGAGCDEEALRVLAMAPKWNPGKQRGKTIRQKMVLPLTFKTN